MRLSTSAKNASADAVADLMDGSGSAMIKVYTGSQPSSANDTATGTLLATITLQTVAMGASSSGIASANGLPLSAAIGNSGTAGWFRVLRGNGDKVFDGDITALGDGGVMELDNIELIAGGTITIQTFNLTQP